VYDEPPFEAARDVAADVAADVSADDSAPLESFLRELSTTAPFALT
jgi:hypothetical protein